MMGLLSQPKPQSADATIITLSDRLTHSTMLEDRRAAALALKGFSHGNRELVASSALRGIMEALNTDRDDKEMRRALLETLVILFIKSSNVSVDFAESARRSRQKNKQYISPLLLANKLRPDMPVDSLANPDEISLWLTDEFTQREEAVRSLLELASSSDMFTSLYSLQLLSALVVNRPDRARQAILSAHDGISILVNILGSDREMLREETVLLLTHLTKSSIEFQKLVAFEGAFDKAFDIISQEGGIVYGGVQVETCLELLANLLQYNVSNQKLFAESGGVPHYAAMLEVPADLESWNDAAVSNMTSALHIARIFMVPGAEATQYNQKLFSSAGVLMTVLRMVFGPHTPVPVRVSGLLTAGSLIHRNHIQQEAFVSIDVPYYDMSLSVNMSKEPVVLPVCEALLNWSLKLISIHLFDLRVASFLLLVSSFEENVTMKMNFLNDQIASFKDFESSKPSVITTLVEYDEDIKLNPFRVWFASAILTNLFHDAPAVKDVARAIRVGDASIGEEEMTIIQALSGQLVTSLTFKEHVIPISYLMLLTVWLFDDVDAVSDFAASVTTPQALISYLTANRGGGHSLITESMAAILLGVAYDFSSAESKFSRRQFFELLANNMGRDQYSLRIQRFKDSKELKEFDPSALLGAPKGENGLPIVDFESRYVALVLENINRIQRAVDKDPDVAPSSRVSLEMYDELKIELHEKTKSLKEYQKEKESEIADLSTQLVTLKEELTDLKKSLAAVEADHQELKSVHSESLSVLDTRDKSHKELEDSKSELTKSLSEVSQKLKTMTDAHNSLKTQHDKLKQESDVGRTARTKAEEGVNKLTRELMALTKSQEASIAEAKLLKSNMDKQVQQMAKLTSSETQLKSKIKALEEELQEERANLAQTKDINQKLIDKLRSTADLLKERETEESALENAQEELNELRQQRDQLKSQQDLGSKELKLVKSKLDELRKEKEALSAQKKDADVKITGHEKIKADLEAQLATTASQLEKLTSDGTANSDELKNRDATIKELRQSLADLDKKRQDEKTADEQLIADLRKLNGELLVKAAAKPAGSPKESQDEQKETQTLKEEVAALKKQLAAVRASEPVSAPASNNKKKKGKNAKNDQASDPVIAADPSAHSETKESSTLAQKLAQAESEIKVQESELQEAKQKLSQLSQAEAELRSARTQISQLEAETEKIASLEGTIKDLTEKSAAVDELMYLLDDVSAKKASYKTRLAELSEQVSESEDEEDEEE